MFVLTAPGQSTVTPTDEPLCSSSSARVSVSATTPYLATQYEPNRGTGTRPAIDDVLTMCPPSALRSRIGRNVVTPWITPHRLTSSIHRQSSSESDAIGPIGETPALLQTTWTAPKRPSVVSASACTLAASLTSVRTPTAASSATVASSAGT